ncbi:MAG: amino acid permease [Bacteroidetes bacterium]|nr:amino acid permease [Bacteroidota bacterium]
MSQAGNKFGTFKGVFTPSILTILGVIMYLRMPWIVGQAGLLATLGIILVAHIISATTGLSVASIATDKKVKTGGTYYMISRSLGLPIGGTLGMALFVGLSFSVSLYLIGFAETLLTAFNFEQTLNNIRITGTIILILITIITFISTNLALKTQFIILLVMTLSLASIFMGSHELAPGAAVNDSISTTLPWIALFAIFFPAVTGFEAGVSMSGDLENPKKSIPQGTIYAIIVGLIVYIAMAFFLYYTVDRNVLINDTSVLLNISFYAPLVIAGVWGATLSSAFGSILAAPRILQAMALDRITPKIFSKGVGIGNEPRNALLLSFVIAFAGILIGELNVIARVVSIFFIITYGFLNLTCAIENLAGSDFRPSFRIPAWISIIGALACFVVMVQLDITAMIAATIALGGIFLFLKRKELRLQSGDTWGGIWSSLAKYSLFKLSASDNKNQQNWRPNIILFSGNVSDRPHLIEMTRTLVGKQGVFTNFELVENRNDKNLFDKLATTTSEIDQSGKAIITRHYTCNHLYDGMKMIARVYGFSGFEPNTIFMGWAKNTKDPEKFLTTIIELHALDFNLIFLNHKKKLDSEKSKTIDLWWNGNSRNLNFGIALLKYITTDQAWRNAKVRVLIVNYNSAKTESIYALINQIIDNSRLIGKVKVINNATEKLSEYDIVKSESAATDLTIIELKTIISENKEHWSDNINKFIDLPSSVLLIEAGSGFEALNANNSLKATVKTDSKSDTETISLYQKIKYPAKELLAEEVRRITLKHEELQNNLLINPVRFANSLLKDFHKEINSLTKKIFSNLEKGLSESKKAESELHVSKVLSDSIFQINNKLDTLKDVLLVKAHKELSESLNVYLESLKSNLDSLPEKISIRFERKEFDIIKSDPFLVKLYKLRAIIKGKFKKWPIRQKVEFSKAAKLFLFENRQETIWDYYQQFGLSTFNYVSQVRRCLVDLNKGIEQIQFSTSKETINTIIDLKQQTSQLLIDALNDFEASNQNSFLSLNSDLEHSLQRLSGILDKTGSKHLLYPYKKILERKNIPIDNLTAMPEIWQSNIRLFVNKSLLEFTFLSLRQRLNNKLNKQIGEINLWVKGNHLETIETIKKMLGELKTSADLPKTKNILKKFNELKNPVILERFELFLKEINEIIRQLPEKIEVNSEQFFTEIENDKFPESDVRVIDLRQKAQFFIGTELISNARNSMENTSETLRETVVNLADKLRLASFNMQNMRDTEERDADFIASATLKENLISELLKDISEEEIKIKVSIEKLENDLKQHLKLALDPLYQLVFSSLSDEQKLLKKRQKSFRVKPIAKGFARVKSFFSEKLVRILYSKSEGIMLAQKLSRFELEYKISNQSIQEVLVVLSGQQQVLQKIPFYYKSLFTGSTTLDKDLWVERPYEQKEAEKIVARYKAGYSGAMLITGNRNAGKSTFSKYVANTYLPRFELHVLSAPIGGSALKEDFLKALKKALRTEGDPYEYLLASTKQKVIIINDLELWWERNAEGMEVIMEIVGLIQSFGKTVFFIINCGTVAYQLINRLVHFDTYLMGQITCENFDAIELKELVMRRHRTGGLKLKINNKNEEDLTEWNYANLFNKYFNLSGGNSGYVLQTWLTNITRISGKTIYIKPPITPNLLHLNSVSDDLWLVILQFSLHRRCTVDRLSRILRQPASNTQILIRDMQRAGLIEERFPQVYAINTLLEPHLISKLKEKGFC